MSRCAPFLVCFALVTSVGMTTGCPESRAALILTDIEYRPDVGDKREWAFDYDSDGRLEGWVEERAGVDEVERVYNYDSDGRLESVDVDDGDDEVTFDYTWSEGNVTLIEASLNLDDPDQNQTGEIRLATEYSYSDGRLAQTETITEVEIRVSNVLLPYSTDSTETETQKYEVDDQGRIIRTKLDIEYEALQDYDADIIPDNEDREETSAEEDFSYDDQGRLVSIDGDVSFDGSEDDDEVRASSALDFKYNDEGKLTDSESDIEYEPVGNNNVTLEDTNDEWEYTYDDEGRLVELENDNGDKYEFRYDSGEMVGLTFGPPGGTPAASYFDLKGKGFYQAPSPLTLTP